MESKSKTMKKIISLLILLTIISCDEDKKPAFSLSGETDEIKNGTYLYLHDLVENKTIDSAMVGNNSFNFETPLPEVPLWVMLHTKDRSKFRDLWLENKAMTFDATNSDFSNALVTGSRSEDLSQEISKAVDTLPENELQGVFQEFVRDHPNNIVSAFVLSNHTSFWGKELSSELYGDFSLENKNTFFGKKISTYLKEDQSPQIGDQFIDFTMSGADGKPRKLSDLKGKIILLEFWASWCRPCRVENPNLVKTYKTFKPQGFEIFAVSLDTNKGYWTKAIEKDGLEWPHVSDLKGRENKAVLLYVINGIPDNLLINEAGMVIGRNLRGEELNQKLSELML